MADQIRIFVSHSGKDVELAAALVHCLEGCLDVPDRTIRCSSVPGYKLDPGVDADETLRQNLAQCSVVIGLLTEDSLASGYVIMELGAAWGLGKTTCAILEPKIAFSRIPGPLARKHAIKADSDHDVAAVVDVVAEKTGLPVRNRARSTASISAFVKAAKGP